MNLYLYTVDEWDMTGKSTEFHLLTRYQAEMAIAERVEKDVWKNLLSSQIYLVETAENIDLAFPEEVDPNILDRVLLWQWQRAPSP